MRSDSGQAGRRWTAVTAAVALVVAVVRALGMVRVLSVLIRQAVGVCRRSLPVGRGALMHRAGMCRRRVRDVPRRGQGQQNPDGPYGYSPADQLSASSC